MSDMLVIGRAPRIYIRGPELTSVNLTSAERGRNEQHFFRLWNLNDRLNGLQYFRVSCQMTLSPDSLVLSKLSSKSGQPANKEGTLASDLTQAIYNGT